jgi:hypothetical protein
LAILKDKGDGDAAGEEDEDDDMEDAVGFWEPAVSGPRLFRHECIYGWENKQIENAIMVFMGKLRMQRTFSSETWFKF